MMVSSWTSRKYALATGARTSGFSVAGTQTDGVMVYGGNLPPALNRSIFRKI